MAPRLLVALLSAGAVVLLVAASPAPRAAAAEPLPRVTVISDSILTSVSWHEENLPILTDGFDMTIDAGVCRRLVLPSCLFNNAQVPNALAVIQGLGTSIAPTVVISDGYNEFTTNFAADIETTLQALQARGVGTVFWLKLHEFSDTWQQLNAILEQEARAHPQLLHLIDWNGFSAGHDDWFQTDEIHLTPAGGAGVAALINASLRGFFFAAAAPPLALTTAALPATRRGRSYRLQLQAGGGASPYHWHASARLPAGLHLTGAGLLWGRPRRGGPVTLTVEDADGVSCSVRLQLRLRPS